MDNWRAHILQEFTPQIARLTLVADPDGLLIEEGVLQGIQDRGFEVIPFEDPIAFGTCTSQHSVPGGIAGRRPSEPSSYGPRPATSTLSPSICCKRGDNSRSP